MRGRAYNPAMTDNDPLPPLRRIGWHETAIPPPPFADAKGTPAYGLVAAKGDTLKLAYSLDKEKQPTDFSGKHGFAFEMKKSSAK